MKKTKCPKKRLIAMFMMVIMVTTIVSNTIVAEAATAMENVSITCYVRGNSKVNTYKEVNGAYSGYIAANDECTILAVYSNGWVQVKYPVGNSKKIAFTESSNFFVDTNFSNTKVNTSSSYTVYKKSNMSSKLGSVYANDSVICVGMENSKQQIIYPISAKSNQFKMGFIDGTISGNVSGNTQNTSAAMSTLSSIEELCFNADYYASQNGDLKAAFGNNEEQLRNHWKNYGIKEGRTASPILDLKYYVSKNADLKKAFGTDYAQAYSHFINYGYKEFRASSPYYYGNYYRNAHGDLKNFDALFLLNHYCQCGIAERRKAGDKLFTGSYSYKNSAASGNNISSNNGVSSSGLLFPIKGKIETSSDKETNKQRCDYRTGKIVPIYAPTDGTVTYKQAYRENNGKKQLSSYGNYIQFKSNDGVYTVLCAHLSSFYGVDTPVKATLSYPCPGSDRTDTIATKTVKQGDLIGYSGKTGNASGHHLHLEVKKNGVAVNPVSVFKEWN